MNLQLVYFNHTLLIAYGKYTINVKGFNKPNIFLDIKI